MILARLPRVRRLRRRALAAALVGVPLITSGCGPSVPVQLGIKDVPLDITVGNDAKPPVPRGGRTPAPLDQALPAFVPAVASAAPPPAVRDFIPPAPLVVGSGVVCPQLDPTKASPAAATPEVDGAATVGKWPNRNSGTLAIDGATVALPAQDTWVVSAAEQSSQGVYDFTEHGITLGFPGADATFHASNSTSAPANPLVSPTSSFGLSRLVVNFPGGAWTFHPAHALQLLATPAAANSTYKPDPSNPAVPNTTGSWNDVQSDPTDGSTMSIQATDLGHVRVNACGTPVDAWQVEATVTITGTTIATAAGPSPATTDLTLHVVYSVATGLGGLIVDEQVKTLPNNDGSPSTFAGVPFTDTTSSTLSAPKPAPS